MYVGHLSGLGGKSEGERRMEADSGDRFAMRWATTTTSLRMSTARTAMHSHRTPILRSTSASRASYQAVRFPPLLHSHTLFLLLTIMIRQNLPHPARRTRHRHWRRRKRLVRRTSLRETQARRDRAPAHRSRRRGDCRRHGLPADEGAEAERYE